MPIVSSRLKINSEFLDTLASFHLKFAVIRRCERREKRGNSKVGRRVDEVESRASVSGCGTRRYGDRRFSPIPKSRQFLSFRKVSLLNYNLRNRKLGVPWLFLLLLELGKQMGWTRTTLRLFNKFWWADSTRSEILILLRRKKRHRNIKRGGGLILTWLRFKFDSLQSDQLDMDVTYPATDDTISFTEAPSENKESMVSFGHWLFSNRLFQFTRLKTAGRIYNEEKKREAEKRKMMVCCLVSFSLIFLFLKKFF